MTEPKASREPRVVFGFHAVLARLRADPASVLEIFLDETRNDARAQGPRRGSPSAPACA